MNQDGLYKVGDDNFKRLNTRLNVENQTTKWLKLGFKALYNYSTSDKPISYNNKDVWARVVYSQPTEFIQAWQKDARYPELDKFEGMYMENNAYSLLKNGGRKKSDKHDIWLTASADLSILKGWNAHVDFNYNLNYQKLLIIPSPLHFLMVRSIRPMEIQVRTITR